MTESVIRLGSFFGVLIVMIVWEIIAPRRSLQLSREKRWPFNLSVVILNTLIVRLFIPISASGVAFLASKNQWGVFNNLTLNVGIVLLLSVLILDFLIYLQHVLFHHVPIFWRFHKVHHIDQGFDVTTGIRFHPVEIVLSLLIKCGAVIVIGIPVTAVLIFEVLLNGTAMFNHGNIRLPLSVDKVLRFVLVTPDMHRVHHSVIPNEYNRNFGFNLPWWDYVFKTYKAQPKEGHDLMEIGLKEYQYESQTGPVQLLLIPFLSQTKKESNQ